MQILGLDVCRDTIVGDEMIRGISGGQKKRVTTGSFLLILFYNSSFKFRSINHMGRLIIRILILELRLFDFKKNRIFYQKIRR